MPNIKTGTTTIKFGSVLRIGYRPFGSTSAFTYIPNYPGPDDLPDYTFSVPTAGTWEVEYTEICASCSNNRYSTPIVNTVSVS